MNKINNILVITIIVFLLINCIDSTYANNENVDNIIGSDDTQDRDDIHKYKKIISNSTIDYNQDNRVYIYNSYPKNNYYPQTSTFIKAEEWDIIVPDDFPSIQTAIDNSKVGYKIFVRSGIYYEHITIELYDIVLLGESPDTTIIDGGNQGNVVYIKGNNVNLSGFTVQHSGMNDLGIYYAGVKLSDVDGCLISNCKIKNNKGNGVVIENSVNCILFQNLISMNQYDGVYLGNTNHILITETYLENNYENEISCYNSSLISLINNSIISTNLNTILFSFSHNSVISENNITGLGFDCIQLRCSSFNIIKQNTINSETNSALSLLYKSNNNTITNNTIIDISSSLIKNSIGIINQDSEFNEINDNLILAFNIGIDIQESIQIEIQFNKIILNDMGISLNNCNNIRIIKNNLSYNTNALYTKQSNLVLISNNIISHNTFEGIHLGLYSDFSDVIDNYIVYNRGNGVNLYSCQYNNLSNNYISFNGNSGMLIHESSFSHINDNTFISNSQYGLHLLQFDFRKGNHKIMNNYFYDCGVFNERSFNNNFHNNIINSRDLLYLEDVKDRIISDKSYGSIILVKCENITIKNQCLNKTSVGVQLIFCSNCSITQNEFKFNSFGVSLDYSSSIYITKNNFIENEIDSIYTIWLSDSRRTNIWDSNYWDSSYLLFFPIHGYKYIYILDIWLIKLNNVCFDLHPSKTPYNYENYEVGVLNEKK
jgi:parallel beta-helix repeat protein